MLTEQSTNSLFGFRKILEPNAVSQRWVFEQFEKLLFFFVMDFEPITAYQLAFP